MSSRPGCLRPALFGCSGLLGLVVLVALIVTFMAWRGVQQREIVAASVATGERAAPVLTARAPGRVILDLGQGEFYLSPAAPGEGVSVRARYDQASHTLTDSLTILPDSTWVYEVTYRTSISMLQAMLQALIGGESESRIEVFLPPDLPIALEMRAEQGGAEVDLGGLWLTEADIAFSQGGIELEFSEPLREPLGSLNVRTSMGGVSLAGLGNASPRTLAVRCRMGGADVDLSGPWANDCRASFDVKFGGVSIRPPAGLVVRPASEARGSLAADQAELPEPTFWYDITASMGEVEITR
jgi:hypothetical protein